MKMIIIISNNNNDDDDDDDDDDNNNSTQPLPAMSHHVSEPYWGNFQFGWVRCIVNCRTCF